MKQAAGTSKRRAGRTVAAALAATVLAGCSTFTSEDFKTLLGGVGQVAQAVGEHEAARRAGRGGNAGNTTANANAATAAPVQAADGGETAYAALACARVTRRGTTVCMENACGGMVMLHGRSGYGTYGPVALAAGQCAPVLPGTVAAVACKVGDRFDWQRSACVSA